MKPAFLPFIALIRPLRNRSISKFVYIFAEKVSDIIIRHVVKDSKTVDFYIRKAWQKILRMYNIEAAKQGSTMSVGFILLNIDREGTPSTQLGPKVGIEKSSLSRTLKWMEDAGLIYRKSDKTDRRISRIFITPFGLGKRRLAREAVLAFNMRVTQQIPEEKLAVFLEVIEQITQIAIENEASDSTFSDISVF